MNLEVINTGTELLLGRVINTNLGYFGEKLFELGLRIQRQTCVPDGDDIRTALVEAFPRSEVILVTGGLGPTSDDITREVVAEMLERELVLNEGILAELERFFLSRGSRMNPNNRRQAMVPRGGVVLDNPNGTAPGLYLPAVPGSSPHLFLLPGPPRELKPMFENLVMPRLRDLLGADAAPECRNLAVFGVGESTVAARVEDDLAAMEGLEYGYCHRIGEVDIRVIGPTALVDAAAAIIRAKFENELFSEEGESLEEVVIGLLAASGATVSTAESCTGGLIASTLTDVSGSSAVFHRGYITYADEAKTELLGVPEALLAENGAVSEPVARAMAEGCRMRSGATHALAVSGIAGPTGGTDEKPVGTVYIALASDDAETFCKRFFFPSGRAMFKQRTARAAIDLLRRRLQGKGL